MLKFIGTNNIEKSKIFLEQIQTFQHQRNLDLRGEFTRIIDFNQIFNGKREFKPVQISYSSNLLINTRRGLHVRLKSPQESKIVRPIKGSIFDVLLDCRKDSITFGTWVSLLLDSKSGDGVIIPGGVAHGIQTLEDNTLVVYIMDQIFREEIDLAINSNDLDLQINWPINENLIMSEKDLHAQSWHDFVSYSTNLNND